MNSENNDIDVEAIGSPPRVFGIRLDLIGLVCGPAAMGFWLALVDLGLPPQAHRLAGVLLLTIIWWVTEPVPIAITGLFALALAVAIGAVPLDAEGKPKLDEMLSKFSSSSFFFLLGGMFIGRAMARHGLDRRVALSILTTRWAGSSPITLLAAVGAATALISMWIANVAATAMIYPVALSMIAFLGTGASNDERAFARSPFASALLLMTAYASTVGGITTPIGTATNLIAVDYIEKYYKQSVDFFQWSLVGLPLTIVLFGGLLLWLRWLGPPGNLNLPRLREYLAGERTKLGRWTIGEVNTLIVFLLIVGLWLTPAPLTLFATKETKDWFENHFPEPMVAVLAPLFLYLLPVDWRRGKFTLEPGDFLKIDWSTLALFGAGLCLGGLMQSTGLAKFIADAALGLVGKPDVWKITALAIAGGVLLSEITSNTATAAALIPITYALCNQAGVNALPPLMGVTLGASFGNALPVSTPPNAIVYSSGLVQIRRMVVSGLGLDILSGVLIWCVLRIAFQLGWTPWISQ